MTSTQDEIVEPMWVYCASGDDHGKPLPFGVFCRHCGAFQSIATPIEIDVYIATARAFGKSHARCTESVPGAEERLEREMALALLREGR